MKDLIKRLGEPRRSTRDLSFIILGTMFLAMLFALINPNFVDKFNLISMGQNLAPYAILALGTLMPISMGGTDLSVGAVCIGSAVVAGTLYNIGMPFGFVIPVMILFGAVIGFINGYLIAKRHIQPFIATLGMMMFVRGTTALFAGTSTVLFPSGCWYNNVFSSYNSYPISFLWIALFSCLMFFIYRKTKLGRYFVSIGSSEKASRISGVDVDKYKIIGYVGCGIMAGIAAIFWSASFATVTVATGNGMELDAIASVYIGGTSIAGGLANVFGCLIGSIMLVVIRSGLNFSLVKFNIPVNSTYVTFVISGVVVVMAVLLERTKKQSVNKNNKANRQGIIKLISYALSIALFVGIIGISVTNKTTSAVKTNDKTICLLMKSEGMDYWDKFEDGAHDAGKELGYTVICRGTESEDPSFLPKQREIASTLLSENPRGFGICAITDGFTDIVEEAYNKKIPLIAFDSGLQGEDLKQIKSSGKKLIRSSIKADDYINATIAAEKAFPLVRDEIIESEHYVVGIIQFANTVYADARANGFADKFKELAEADKETSGKCEIVIEMKPSNINNAYKEALEFLYEKEAKLIFASNLLVCNQCADAISSSSGKYDGLKFVGYDTGEKIEEWLKQNGKTPLLGTISQNPYMIGYLSAKTLINIDNGEKAEEAITIPGEWITKENIDTVK